MFSPVEVDAANLLEAKKTARLVLLGTEQGLVLCSLGLEFPVCTWAGRAEQENSPGSTAQVG